MEKRQEITACVFLHKDGKALVAKRAATKKFLPGKWELLGGHIEFGETIEEGLKREIREEIHIEVELDQPYYAFTYVRDTTIHMIEIDYLGTMQNVSQEIRINPEDHSEYRWISEEQIDILFPPFDARPDPEHEAVKRGFRALKH